MSIRNIWCICAVLMITLTYTSCVPDKDTKSSDMAGNTEISSNAAAKPATQNSVSPKPVTTNTSSTNNNTESSQDVKLATQNKVSQSNSDAVGGTKLSDKFDTQKEKAISKAENSKTSLKTTPTNKLPDACSLVSDAFIAQTIGVEVAAVTIKDGTSPASLHSRSCFFKWDHEGVPNSGVLIQIQENPVPEEIDEWAAYYIQAKINQGETNPNTMESIKYKKLENIGVAGAYNFDMHRYLWRTEDDKVFMIAFNMRATEEEELSWVRTLGAEVMKNYR